MVGGGGGGWVGGGGGGRVYQRDVFSAYHSSATGFSHQVFVRHRGQRSASEGGLKYIKSALEVLFRRG